MLSSMEEEWVFLFWWRKREGEKEILMTRH
jgi:hypothetical protein